MSDARPFEMSPCPRCGAPLPAGAAADSCPRCLLAAGLESAPPGDSAAPGEAAAKPAPTAPSPGEIGRHFPALEVLELLGQGGMGIVYKARQRTLGRLVALKVMPPDAAREPGFAERFTREAQTLARLQHPGIVGVHDFGVSDGLYYLLMEYVDGANLRQAMRSGALTPGQALAIVPQICDALQFAHEQGVVHRDVKPENILLDRAGRVRIADFGLAKIVQRTPVDVTLTRAGQVMGTLHYMAPEQYRAPDAVDHRADIYSLGVVFYEMLTGELPLGSFPPPSEKAHVDHRLDRVVLRALESERDRRWQSASDVKTRMSEIAAGPDVAAASPPPIPEGAKRVHIAPLGVTVTKDASGKNVEIAGVSLGKDAAGNAHVHVGGQALGPDGKPLPVSKLAIVGGLGVPAAIVAGLVVWGAMHAAGSEDAALVSMASSSAVLLAGWISSMVAWGRISHSAGALGGRGWAITGTFLPFAFACCGWPLSFLWVGATSNQLGVHEGPDGRRVDMPFLHVEENADGSSHVRMPGIEVREGADGTSHVKLPGIEVHDTDRVTRVKVGGVAVTADDRAEAVNVTGGPATLTGSDRAALVATMRRLWSTAGPGYFSSEGLRAQIGGRWVESGDVSFFHLVLAADGLSGHLVLSGPNATVIAPVQGNSDGWSLGGGEDSQFRAGGPATDDDRDGVLGK